MNHLKKIVDKTPGTEFMNEVRAAQAKGADYSLAFHNTAKRHPDLVLKMRRAPASGPAQAAIRHRLKPEFANAADDLGSNLYVLFPADLKNALGLAESDSDDDIKDKIAQRVGSLNSTQMASLSSVILNAITKTSGAAKTATDRMKQLFPKLLSMVGQTS